MPAIGNQVRLDSATHGGKRWVLDALGTRLTIGSDKVDISLGVPNYGVDSDSADWIRIAQGFKMA